ncbi:MAG: hypothetical protein CMJ28_01610 [Phycisphaerae bacterium]|nr:hypothetical protein [Phycisphaerae bacterium]
MILDFTMHDSTPRLPFSRKLLRSAIVLAVLLAGPGSFVMLVRSAPDPSESIVDVPPVALEVYSLSEALIPRQASAFGRVRPLNRISRGSEVAGPVVWRADLDSGDAVLAGEVLVRLDPASFESRLAAAKAAVQSATAALADLQEESAGLVDRRPALASQRDALARESDRLLRAVQSGAVGSSAFDQAEAARLRAEDTLTQLDLALRRVQTRRSVLEAQQASTLASEVEAQDQLNRCEITAGLDGRLDGFDVQLGERVAVGQIIASVIGQQRVELELTIPAGMFGVVGVGDKVSLRRSGIADSRTAFIDRIAPSADPEGRTFQAWVEANVDDMLLPGVFVEATVSAGDPTLALVAPRSALLGEALQTVDAQGRLKTIPVQIAWTFEGPLPETGLPDTEWAVLRVAPPAGTQIIRRAGRRLPDGLRVDAVRVLEGAK